MNRRTTEVRGPLYVNDINTIHGFKWISMFPKMYAELLNQLIPLALARHERKKATRYTRD